MGKRLAAALLAVTVLLGLFSSCAKKGEAVAINKATNAVDYKPGGNLPEKEDYLQYKAIVSRRFEYSDMINHKYEVAAVRLAEKGVFPQEGEFHPDEEVKAVDFLRWLIAALGADVGNLSDADIIATAEKAGLTEGIVSKYNEPMTRQQMIAVAANACEDSSGFEQYAMMLDDAGSIDAACLNGVLRGVALGLAEPESFKIRPTDKANKAEAADIIYRVINAGERATLPYDLGSAYKADQKNYLLKSSLKANPGGIRWGFWSIYSAQSTTFNHFGKRTVDRVDFDKWSQYEKTKGVYEKRNFANAQSAHRAGSTVITSVNFTASQEWNPGYPDGSYIPSFYPQDITHPETREAAKKFLYQYVQAFLNDIEGDLILSIDYEIDWQINIMGASLESQERAKKWAAWYVEACEVARKAAADINASDRLQLCVIYNWVSDLHKKGQTQNQWMIDVTNASDIIGLDTYAGDSTDVSSPAKTMESIRFMVNNYTLGKPFFIVENGFDCLEKNVTANRLSGTEEQQAEYWQRLFREFRYEMGPGGFLNNNMRGFLVWALRDMADQRYGMLNAGNKPREATKAAVYDGIKYFETRRLYTPSLVEQTVLVDEVSSIPIEVKSGDTYDKLTLLRNLDSAEGHELTVELKNPGSVMIEINGTTYKADTLKEKSKFTFKLKDGLKTGFNYIHIYIGANKVPFTNEVTKVEFK